MKLSPLRRRTAAFLWLSLPVVAIGGWFYPYLGYLVIPCMIAPIIVGIFRGRHWCGWFCPRGAFFDFIMRHFTPNRTAPPWIRSKAFRTGVLIFLMGMMTVQISMVWPDGRAIGRVFVLLLGVTTVVGIGLAVTFKPRTWCTFCPMGTMANWVSHGKRPLVVSEECKECAACAKDCPMDLTPYEGGPAHADCLKCNQCVLKCPLDALSFQESGD